MSMPFSAAAINRQFKGVTFVRAAGRRAAEDAGAHE